MDHGPHMFIYLLYLFQCNKSILTCGNKSLALMNHSGKVICRGIFLHGKVYKHGEFLPDRDRELLSSHFKQQLDNVGPFGFIYIGFSINDVYFVADTMTDPPFLTPK